jgi:hypothetical protein
MIGTIGSAAFAPDFGIFPAFPHALGKQVVAVNKVRPAGGAECLRSKERLLLFSILVDVLLV